MVYKAFISYSHAADGKLAPAIQRALHRIAKPWYRLRTMRVFRDQTNLATTPGLWTSIESALANAEFFVYLASPTAAQSPWVQKEVEWWLKNRSYLTFLILLTDGEIVWDNAQRDLNWITTTAMPKQTSKAFAEEPLYTDLRWARTVDQLSLRHAQFRTSLLDLASTLLNRPKDELDGEDVRQYRRTRRIAWSGAITLSVLFVAALLAAYFATQQSMLATARALGAQSEAVLATNPELALLLAREALKYKADDEAEFALRLAFTRNPERMIHYGTAGRNVVARFIGSDKIVIAEQGEPASVWDVTTNRRIADLPSVVENEFSLDQPTDSSVVGIAAADESSFTLYDTKSWKALPALQGANARISRDGRVISAVDGDKIQQWILPSLQPRQVNASAPEGYTLRDVSKDGSLLLLAKEGEITDSLIVEAQSGKILSKIPQRILREGTVLTPDGRFLVVERNSDNAYFELWDAHAGKLVRTFEGDVGWVTYVAINPNSKAFVIGDRSGSLSAWDVETGERIPMLSPQRNDIFWIRFSPDGETMLTVAADGTACLWDTATMRCLVTLGGKGDEAFDVGFAADSRHFFTTHMDGTVRVWDRQMWQSAETVPAAQTVVSEDGTLILSTKTDPIRLDTAGGPVTIWNAENGQAKTALQQTPAKIKCMAISRSRSLVAIAPTEGIVALWNAQTGLPALQFDKSSVDTTALAFDSTGAQLATVSKEGVVRFWNTSDGKLLGEWPKTEGEIYRVVFHPDGHRVIVARGRFAEVRERQSGKLDFQAELAESAEAEAMVLNADGSLLLIAGDTFPQIWDLNSNKRVQTLKGHSDEVYSGAFSHDGRWLLTGSGFKHARGMPPDDGNSVFLWDRKTDRLLLSYRSATWAIETLSFANDGRRIVAGGGDGRLRYYDCGPCLPLSELLKVVSSRTARELTADERARYVSESTLLGWIIRRFMASN